MKEAIVLAGGFGTRLSHIVSDVPKPMAPVAGRPFLCYLMDYLQHHEYDHVVLSTGYMHEKIEGHFGNSYNGMALSYAHETTPLGTGGGMLNALSHCQGDDVLVLNGDTLFLADLATAMRRHTERQPQLTMILRHVDNVARYGAVVCDEEGRIVSFLEKNASSEPGLINGGTYIVKRSLFDGFSVGDRFSFETDILQARYRNQYFFGHPSSAYFIDIGIPEDYFRAQKEFPNLLIEP